MNDMQRDLDELGRRLWPRSDALRPARTRRGASGRNHGERGRRVNLLVAVAVVTVVVAILAVPIVLGRLQSRHIAPAVPPQPTAKVSPGPLLHHNGQIVMGVDNSLIAIDPATGNQRVILSVPAGEVVTSPAYSPDGTKLAYLRGHVVSSSSLGHSFILSGSPDEMESIWVLDTATGHSRQLTTCQGCSPYDYVSWSPDGTRLAFTEADQGGSLQLHVIDADGTHRTQLTHFMAGWNATQPNWSPDGTRIAFTLFTVAYNTADGIQFPQVSIDVITPDGTGSAVLFGAAEGLIGQGWIGRGGSPYLAPTWSPDGSKIAYLLDPWPPGLGVDSQLWVMDPHGSHRTLIFQHTNCCVKDWGGPTWSPDGMRIAVVTAWTLRVMRADGSDPTSLGVISGDRPAWQPVP
jgi:Tol biopolymer transport system component